MYTCIPDMQKKKIRFVRSNFDMINFIIVYSITTATSTIIPTYQDITKTT